MGVSDAYGSYGSTGSCFRFFADVVRVIKSERWPFRYAEWKTVTVGVSSRSFLLLGLLFLQLIVENVSTCSKDTS